MPSLWAFRRALEMPYALQIWEESGPSAKSLSPQRSPVRSVASSSNSKLPASSDSWRPSKGGVPASFPSMKDAAAVAGMVPESAPSRRTHRSFVHAVIEICTAHTLRVASNNAQNLSIRNLCGALAQLCPDLFKRDEEWLRAVISSYEVSENAALRLLGCKLVSALLNNELAEYRAQGSAAERRQGVAEGGDAAQHLLLFTEVHILPFKFS